MKITWISLITGALALCLLSSCDQNGFCRNAKGSVNTIELTFPAITGVQISEIEDVTLDYGPVQKVVITAEEDILDNLNFRVENGTLVTDIDGCWKNYELQVAVTLAAPLASAATSGNGSITSLGLIPANDDFTAEATGTGDINLNFNAAKQVEATVSGAGSITLSGACDFFDAKNSGTGRIHAFDLVSFDTKVNASGTGLVEVHTGAGFLNASTSGTANIYYKGTPSSVVSTATGVGRVIKVD